MSKEVEEIRHDLENALNDEQNRGYYIRRAKEKLAALDEYLDVMDNAVRVMSARISKK